MAISRTVYEDYPPALSPEQEGYLVQLVKDWSIQHGLTVRPPPSFISREADPHAVLATNAPVTIFPSPFPKSCFNQAREIQCLYNELYATIANDEGWLEGIVKEYQHLLMCPSMRYLQCPLLHTLSLYLKTSHSRMNISDFLLPCSRLMAVDDFIANLWKVHLQVKEEGYVQPLSLGLFRSDYMLHTPTSAEAPSLKQVEFNTISSSFGGLANLVAALHTHLATLPTPSDPLVYPQHALFNTSTNPHPTLKTTGIPPPNDAVETLCAGLASAHTAYGPSKSSPGLPTCILFLVQDNERNIFDQLALSSHLQTAYFIPSFRLSASQILHATSIPPSNPSRPLIYTPPFSASAHYEVSLVYFRALYSSDEYQTPASWSGRHHLERSAAIKCPTVLTHLAGSKKVQQALTTPQTLEHFLPHHPASSLTALRSTFAPQYDLSPGSTGLRLATDHQGAVNHVLKPQREGGGNNIHRSSIPNFLKSIPESAYSGYILMELIKTPPEAKNTVLRSDGSIVCGNVISELGIFGACLWKRSPERTGAAAHIKVGLAGAGHAGIGLMGHEGQEILHNEQGGYLLRTKGKDSDEGGVASGFSSLDSLILYE